MHAPRDLTGDLSRDLTAHSAALRRVARAVALDGASADDLVQDTWVAAVVATRVTASGGAGETAQTRPSPPRSLGAWLRTVLRRHASARRARERHVPLDVDPAADGTPFDAAACAEAAARLAAAVQRLPALDRDVVVRRFWHDEPPRRIADALGLDARAVRNRLHRSLERLREDLGRDRRTLLGLAALVSPLPTPHAAALAALLPLKLALTAAFAVLVGLFLWDPFRAPRRDEVLPGQGAALPNTTPPAPVVLADLARPGGAPPGARAEAPAPTPAALTSQPPTDAPTDPLLMPGLLWIEVVDGLDQERTFDFVLTVALDPAQEASAPRDIAGQALTDVVPLPVGRYRGALYAVGRDPVDLGNFTISPSRATNLGSWMLPPGSSSLEVAVAAPEGATFRVELHGGGRRAGDCCVVTAPERCPV